MYHPAKLRLLGWNSVCL